MFEILKLIMGRIWIIYIVILINKRRWSKNAGLFKTDFDNVVHFELDVPHSTELTIIV